MTNQPDSYPNSQFLALPNIQEVIYGNNSHLPSGTRPLESQSVFVEKFLPTLDLLKEKLLEKHDDVYVTGVFGRNVNLTEEEITAVQNLALHARQRLEVQVDNDNSIKSELSNYVSLYQQHKAIGDLSFSQAYCLDESIKSPVFKEETIQVSPNLYSLLEYGNAIGSVFEMLHKLQTPHYDQEENTQGRNLAYGENVSAFSRNISKLRILLGIYTSPSPWEKQ